MKMGAADKCLNLTMLSAQGLKDVCTFGTMSPYAKAWIHRSAKQRTPIAANAGCTPVWGHKIHLSLPPNALREEKLSLTIEIWNQGSASDTLVGSANLPLCDLLTSTKPNGLEFMACQLMRPSGKVQGLVNFSIEISDNGVSAPGCTSSKESPENCKETSSSSTVSGVWTIGNLSGDQIHDSNNYSSTELKEPVKWSVLQSGKPVEAAPDALGTGHGFCTSSDPRGGHNKPGTPRFSSAPDVLGTRHGVSSSSDPRGELNKPGTPGTKHSSAPDALDLPHGAGHSHGDRNLQGDANSLGDGHSQGDGHSSSNGGGGARGPQNSLPGVGGLMLGGVIGALLMGESVNVRNDGSASHSGTGEGPGGEGAPQP